MWSREGHRSKQFASRKIQELRLLKCRISKRQGSSAWPPVLAGIQHLGRHESPLLESEQPRLSSLRRSRHHDLRSLAGEKWLRQLLCGHGTSSVCGPFPGPLSKQRRQLRKIELPLGYRHRPAKQYATESDHRIQRAFNDRYAVGEAT